MSIKKSCASCAYEVLRDMPADTRVSTATIVKKVPAYAKNTNAVYNIMYVMSEKGYLKKSPHENGVFYTNAITNEFHTVHMFHGLREKRTPVTTEKKDTLNIVKDASFYANEAMRAARDPDIDVIEELLTVMAKAEPVLRKLQSVQKMLDMYLKNTTPRK